MSALPMASPVGFTVGVGRVGGEGSSGTSDELPNSELYRGGEDCLMSAPLHRTAVW